MPRSFSESAQAPCPQCGQPVDLEIWTLVDLEERPDLAERVRDGTLHDAPCPHCGHAEQVDAPLLCYRPGDERPLLFSPAQRTSQEQDREHAAGLLARLRESLGDAWRDEWVAGGLPGVPRAVLPALLSGDAEAIEAAWARLRAAAEEGELPSPSGRGAGGEGEDFADLLIAWIQTPDWQASEAYLEQHAANLLTDEAETALERLRQINPDNRAIPEHQELLQRARQVGIAAMYAEIRLQRRLQALPGSGPIGTAVAQFIQAGDDEAAVLLHGQSALLLTWDAGQLIDQVVRAAREAGDEGLLAHLQARYRQWQAARVGGETSHAPDAAAGRAQAQLLEPERGARYEITGAAFTAIGDNAVTLNVLNFGAVTLHWQRPQMARPDLAEDAVGRREELDRLRRQLHGAAGETAIVGKGRSRAVSGMPGVGKSTLAALYAQEYVDSPLGQDTYPGGVLWLQLGPSYTSEESVRSALSGLAALAYSGDGQRFRLDLPPAAPRMPEQTLEQVQRTLQNAIFAPEAVQRLLAGHGRMLVIVDDLWERNLWPTVRRALPAQAHVLVTTRHDLVARAVGQSLALDVLSQKDALDLIAQELPQMPAPLAERLIAIVGAHPMALRIALGDLHPDDPPDEWATALERIHDRLARGLGVDPTTLEDIEPERRLSAIMAYSYEALGHSEALRRAFRALGSLAPEAAFATPAVAALCELPEADALDLLKTLRDRNLLRRVRDRWQQHALLRSYALERQTPAERLAWAERHAAYYLEAMRAADDAQTYYTMLPDLPNLRHAFDWAAGEGRALGLAQALLSNCANLLESQNLGLEYLAWAERVRALAAQVGSPHDRGRALGSLGNALQNAATLADRAGRLRQALAAYDEALALRRDVPLDYAQTQNNRAVLLSDLATLPGEDRAGRLRQALADIASALRIFEQVQQAQYLHVGRRVLAGLVVAMGVPEFRAAWAALTGQPIPPLPAEALLSALAEQAGITSQDEFSARLQSDPAFRQQAEGLAALAGEDTAGPDAGLPAAQALADLLIAWIQTPDWQASEAYLEQHAAELLTGEAETVLERLRQINSDSGAIPEHQRLLRRARQAGIASAYQEFHAARQAAQDPVAQAVAALLQVDSMEVLEQTLEQHPLLLDIAVLERLAGLVKADAEQPDVARRLLALLAILLERYDLAHTEEVDLAEQAALVALHESLLPVAEALEDHLAAGLRESLCQALNTLGNAHAEQDDHAAAVEAYTRAIAHAPENATLYRNRAGEHIELGQWAQAREDVERAAELEPDASRLAELRQALAQAPGA